MGTMSSRLSFIKYAQTQKIGKPNNDFWRAK